MKPPTITELDCGHPPTPTSSSITNGIARTAAGWTMCYRCAHDEQILQLLLDDTVCGYITSRPEQRYGLGSEDLPFTTWSGEQLGTVLSLRYSRPRWSQFGEWRMRYVQVRDLHGQLWRGHGTDQHDLITLHKIHSSPTSTAPTP